MAKQGTISKLVFKSTPLIKRFLSRCNQTIATINTSSIHLTNITYQTTIAFFDRKQMPFWRPNLHVLASVKKQK